MKKLILILALVASCFCHAQKKAKWDVCLAAMDSDSIGFGAYFIPNVKMYFGIQGLGDWEINTGARGAVYMSDIAPEVEITFPCNVYLGFKPREDTLEYWEEYCPKDRYKELYLVIDSTANIEIERSVEFEKNELTIKNIEDVQDIVYYLKQDEKHEVLIGSTFLVNDSNENQDLGYKRAKFIKEQVLKQLPSAYDRIDMCFNAISDTYYNPNFIPIDFKTVREEPYLHSENTIVCEFNVRFFFDTLANTVSEKSIDIAENLAEFLKTNSSLSIEIKLFTSANVSQQLAESRFETLYRFMVNQGIRGKRLFMETNPYPSPAKIDSMLARDYTAPHVDEATFFVKEEAAPPCVTSGSPKIHFKKGTDEIFETDCDSLRHLVNLINSDSTTNYYLIGISPSKDQDQKNSATLKAQMVKAKLVEMGVSADRLKVTHSYHKKPGEGKPKDWPYYPDWYVFEIGVYLETDF